ncbi:MAG: 4Fe-4S dicluster domain-containing protein [Akkermansia sp.]
MKRALHRDYLRELVQDCIGCAACQNVCSRDAIRLVDDTDGFLKPLIDEASCVGCRACEHICPIWKREGSLCQSEDKIPQPSFYFGWHRDEHLRYQSSSGGFFTALAQYVLDRGGCVFGVVMEGGKHPRFAMAENLEELAPMRGSKYVQARADGVYRDVRAQLKTGRLVLFSGTPCQVGALYQVLRSRPCNLLTMDIVCHGVPSFHLFRRYLEHIRHAE